MKIESIDIALKKSPMDHQQTFRWYHRDAKRIIRGQVWSSRKLPYIEAFVIYSIIDKKNIYRYWLVQQKDVGKLGVRIKPMYEVDLLKTVAVINRGDIIYNMYSFRTISEKYNTDYLLYSTIKYNDPHYRNLIHCELIFDDYSTVSPEDYVLFQAVHNNASSDYYLAKQNVLYEHRNGYHTEYYNIEKVEIEQRVSLNRYKIKRCL